MKHLLFAASAACISLATAQENYAQWDHYKTLTLNTTASGADVATDVTDFPVLVRLTPQNGGDVVHFSEGNGADVRFTKSDGTTRLPHQIERWDSAQQIADIWVLLDTVYGNNDTQSFRVYWGNDAVADSSNGGAVFDTAKGYASVWHLGDAISYRPRANAIPGRFPATPRNFAPTYHRKPGIAGWSDSLTGGQNFNATSYFAMTEGTESDWFNFSDGAFTYTAWAQAAAIDNATAQFNRLISLTSNNGGTDRIFLSFNGGNIIARVWGENGSSNPINSTTPPPLNEWAHYAMTVTRGETVDTTRLYLNGAQIQEATHSPMTDAQRNYVRIGRDEINNNDFTYTGRIDEARISHVTRSPAYIKLGYETQKPGSTVLTQGAATPATGTVPAPGSGPAAPTLSYADTVAVYPRDSAITANEATVTGAVDTFFVSPALPAGLTLDPATGEITGTPTVASTFQTTHTVVAAGAAGVATATLKITVEAPPVSLRPTDGFAIRVNGTAGAYTFAIAPEAARSTDRLTVSLSDIWGRTVWQKTVHPARDNLHEVTWNGRGTNGSRVAAGMYLVRVAVEGSDAIVSAPSRILTLKSGQ